MLVEFTLLPVGKGVSLSEEVAKAVAIVAQSGLAYKVTEMGTFIEGEWDEVFAVIRRCHAALLRESGRVITTVKVDDRKGCTNALQTRLDILEAKAGKFNR